MKPLIGITCGINFNIKSTNISQLPQEMHQLGDTYVKAIELAGGIPVLIPVYSDPSLIRQAIDRVDAVLLSGGSDLDPAISGQRATSRLRPILPRRDKFDLAVASYVINETKKPLLGICRGIQAMNVAMGGSLYVDLEESGKLAHQLNMYPRNLCSHTVQIEPGTRLAGIFGAGEIGVNSLHHQAVHEPAENFIVAARSTPDDVIEAIELPGPRFVVGIQWHPEGLVDSDAQQAVFRSLVAAAME